MIMALGLLAFVFDTIAGVVFAKILNIFSKTKINPMVGAAGISAFPMSARIVEKMGIAAEQPEPSADARCGRQCLRTGGLCGGWRHHPGLLYVSLGTQALASFG